MMRVDGRLRPSDGGVTTGSGHEPIGAASPMAPNREIATSAALVDRLGDHWEWSGPEARRAAPTVTLQAGAKFARARAHAAGIGA